MYTLELGNILCYAVEPVRILLKRTYTYTLKLGNIVCYTVEPVPILLKRAHTCTLKLGNILCYVVMISVMGNLTSTMQYDG